MKFRGWLSTSVCWLLKAFLAQSWDSLKEQTFLLGGAEWGVTVTFIHLCFPVWSPVRGSPMTDDLLWISNQALAARLANCFIQLLGLLLTNKMFWGRPRELVLLCSNRAKRRAHILCLFFNVGLLSEPEGLASNSYLVLAFSYDSSQRRKKKTINSHTEDRSSWLNLSLSEVKRRD